MTFTEQQVTDCRDLKIDFKSQEELRKCSVVLFLYIYVRNNEFSIGNVHMKKGDRKG